MTARAPVADVVRSGVPVLLPATAVSEAAQAMTAAGHRCAAIAVRGGWAIVTDADLRRRVLAAGVHPSAPVSSVMTEPAKTVDASVMVADATATMIDAGVRHLLVLAADGSLLGVVDDTDLFAGPTRAGMTLRLAIARARTEEELLALGARTGWVTADLMAARVSPLDVVAIGSIVARTLMVRAVELRAPDVPARIQLLGSVARGEAVPSSDVETAAVVIDDGSIAAVTEAARTVHELVGRCGLRSDPHNALASQRRFARTEEGWSAAVRAWIDDPLADRGVVMLSLLLDCLPLPRADGHAAEQAAADVAASVRRAVADSPRASALILREATSERASVVLRDKLFRRAESVDPKASVLSAITGIARWGAVTARSAARSTPDRLAQAAAAGVLAEDDGRILTESFEVVQRIRLTHQCEQVRRGLAPDDTVALDELSPLSRSLLADAAREVAGVQRVLGGLVR